MGLTSFPNFLLGLISRLVCGLLIKLSVDKTDGKCGGRVVHNVPHQSICNVVIESHPAMPTLSFLTRHAVVIETYLGQAECIETGLISPSKGRPVPVKSLLASQCSRFFLQ